MSQPQDTERPLDWWCTFLQRLHDGPLQQGAAVKVALAVWERAATRGDSDGATAALAMARTQLTQLLADLAQLERDGRAHLDHAANDSPVRR